jgi:hypothetical protein
VADLLKNKEEEETKLAELERLPVETMWMTDLDYFIQVLEVRGKPRFQSQNLILMGVRGEMFWREADTTLHLAGLWTHWSAAAERPGEKAVGASVNRFLKPLDHDRKTRLLAARMTIGLSETTVCRCVLSYRDERNVQVKDEDIKSQARVHMSDLAED